jgi:2-amino-4-hydroxy-6-hydroxymethyldihydropteridine diphosphokinase
MSLYRVFVGLGSNLGERQRLLNAAAAEINALPRTKVVWTSSVYETEPVGKKNQKKFLNAVAEIQTESSPAHLLSEIKTIEQRIGRTASEKWGPREIDIDILLYDGVVHNDELVKVPHPEMEKRRFVLIPFREIAPDVVHPVNGMTVEEMASACRDTSKVVKTVHKIIV